MLSTARVALPAPIEARLRQLSTFADNVTDYAREDLIGFRRPLAATFALVAPIALAFAYHAAGLSAAFAYGFVIGLIVAGGIYLIGRREWPQIVTRFQAGSAAKRRAVADLKCGFGEASLLSNGRTPRFFEYEHGVLALADAGDFKTLFFDVQNDTDDPRWALYKEGHLNRRIWRWLRLPVSREIVKFSAEGSKLQARGAAGQIRSIDAWEAINVALGEPLDGSVIHRPFDELVCAVERLL